MTWAIIQDIENIPSHVKEWFQSNPSVKTIEDAASQDWQAFIAKVTPLYNSLRGYAVTTGRADLQVLLSDLETGLGTAITSYLATGGNVGAAVAATAQAEIAKATADISADAKNAIYGGLAIVASNLPQISAPASTIAPVVSPAPATPAAPTPTAVPATPEIAAPAAGSGS